MADGGQQKTRFTVLGIHPSIPPTNVLRQCYKPSSSFFYHYARLIEILAAIEWIERLLDDPDIVSERTRATAGINQLEGIGVSEAPRGTLFHHYQVDEDGLIKKVNLIIATGQNNLALRCAEQ